ncbi:het domain protein [Diplodia corticola]|uniref:Het domain protein n=1 Tax=Diplodia corticola TaxID=236234 RepID=A0A1J9RSQ3_9PEZI|nr:het domain protein [Diplodia corticola]OJD31471.1 het domain protein [Diplodia corticola]
MEHLFIHLDDRTVASKIAEALNSEILLEEELNRKTSLIPPVEPYTEWRGFDHDQLDDDERTIQGELAEYPTARGWTIDRAWLEGDLREAHPDFRDSDLGPADVAKRVAAMVQSWLYFGLLEAFLEKGVHTSYFLRCGDGGTRYIHSGYLGFALYAWKISASHVDATKLLDSSWDSLRVVTSVVQLLYLYTDPDTARGRRTEQDFPGFTESVAEIVPSILRLVDAISYARDLIASNTGSRIYVLQGPSHMTAARDSRLLLRGWCPFLLRFCRDGLPDSVLDWLDGTQRSSVIGGHENCTYAECARNDIDPETYSTLHTEQGCSCSLVRPDSTKVLSIIDHGMIPLVRLGPDSAIEVAHHDPRTVGNYVAISHVWVDGLGSVTEKGLPACQVGKLAATVDSASGSTNTPFWIDSLCIPEANKQRKASIALLRDVYQQAASVLVIDKTITTCPLGNGALPEDFLWAIVSSAWAQRLWTYQESYLARQVQFCMTDSTIITWDQKLPPSRSISTLTVIHTSLDQHLRRLRPPIEQRREKIAQRKTNIGEVATAINWRSTSRVSDETLAVAALLLLDTRKLVDIPSDRPAERMKQLYLLAKNLPHDIIFFFGPTMPSSPFRWAPTSLMARSPVNLDMADQGHSAICTENGLHGRYFALFVDSTLRGRPNSDLGNLYVCIVAGDDGICGINWFTFPWQSSLEVEYDTLIIREVDGAYLKPEIGNVVEAVAVRRKAQSPDGLVCDWAGRVTLLKYETGDSEAPSPEEYPNLPTARWEEKAFIIT